MNEEELESASISKISHRDITHKGIMPICVLQHNLIHDFENMNSGFLKLFESVILELGLDPGIGYGIEEVAVKSPRVVFNKMFVDEPFLSYVWCICFALAVLYDEVIVKKSKNDYFGDEKEVTNKALATKAYKLWEYAVSLLNGYSKWDMDLPNPDLYEPHYDELITQVNGLYLTAMMFVLSHEFAHIELRHNSSVDACVDQDLQNARFEKEADARAISLVMEGSTEQNGVTRRMGVLMGLCSLLFFSSVTKGVAYPDTDDRIDAIIKLVNPDSQDGMWGIATLAYRLWDKQFNKMLEWKAGLESPREQYYSIKAQIEMLNKP